MLRDALPIAHQLGIERALITCDWDNAGSHQTIEANSGIYEDRRGVKRTLLGPDVSLTQGWPVTVNNGAPTATPVDRRRLLLGGADQR